MRPARLALLTALVLALPAVARATVILPVDLEILARRADLIVRGTAGPSSSAFVDGKQIHTVTTVRVAYALKGEASGTIEIRTRGGTVGDLTQVVHGAPEFKAGEEVILFLHRLGERRFEVESFALGKFEVATGPDGGARVGQRVNGLGILGPDGKVRPAMPAEPASEKNFLDRVRRALQAKVTP